MSREIKFRAWDDEMFYDIIVDGDMWTDSLRTDNWYIGNIMQFTGLKDIDGNEVYDGDILIATDRKSLTGRVPKHISHVPKNKPLKVFFHEGAFKFRHNKRSVNHCLSGASIRYHGLVKIGNTYETKQETIK